MERYIIQPEDLKGDITGFPIQVVQRMVDYQGEQGYKYDVTVFQKCKNAGIDGGFDWGVTIEGYDFWNKVIFDKDFNLFFQLYPKDAEKKKVRQNVLYKHFVYLLTALLIQICLLKLKKRRVQYLFVPSKIKRKICRLIRL